MERTILVAVFSIVVLTLLIVTGGCSQPQSDESAIRIAIAEFNKSYESKDVDRWASFFSRQFTERIEKKKDGGIQAWKETFRKNVFSPWKKITITSEIESIDKTGYNCVASEVFSMYGTDWDDREHTIEEEIRRILTFVKEENEWKIGEIRQISLPSVYDDLTSEYADVGRAGLAYVTHISLSFVSVIDTRTNQVIGTIPSGYGANWVAFSPDGERGYITSFRSNGVTVFNKKTNETITIVPSGKRPACVVVTRNGQSALISHESEVRIWRMNTQTNRIIDKVSGGAGPLYLFEHGKFIYQTGIVTPFVFVLDPADGSIARKINVGGRPLQLAFTPDWRYAYVTNFDLNELEKIDTRADSVVSRLSGIGNPRGIAVTPDGRFAYVTNVVSNTVTVIGLSDESRLKVLEVGKMPTSVAITSDGMYAYVTNQASATVSVIDINTNKLVQTIKVADNPITIHIDEG